MAGGPGGFPGPGGFNALRAGAGLSDPNPPPMRDPTPAPTSGGPNSLVPGGGGPDNMSPVPGGSGNRNDPVEQLKAQEAYAKSLYQTVTKSRNMLDHLRREMDSLTQMGDTVTPEDVISAAGRVVGHGVPAKELATILADMPPMGGQGLAAWLTAHDASITQQEQHVAQMQALTQHQMGQASLKVLAGLHMQKRAREVGAASAEAALTAGPLAPRGRAGQGSRPVLAPPGQGPAGVPATSVIQTEQRPQMEGAAAEEAV